MANKQSYLEKLEVIRSNQLAAGLISDRFPAVSGIIFHMTYYQKMTSPVLMVRTVNFFPSDYACFHMECMREGCANGGFDLTPVVQRMIKNHRKSEKGKIVCKGSGDKLASGHASIVYEVSIQYNKDVK